MNSIFLTNASKPSFLEKIKDSLKTTREFYFSISFIKRAGLVLLFHDIEDALKRGVKGKLITSTYQNFTDPSSLQTLLELSNKYPNFECHLDFNCFNENGFHTKGYLFKHDNYSEIVIGSSNITRFALLKNVEWNVSIISNENKEAIYDSFLEFDELWSKTLSLNQSIISDYSRLVDYAIERWDMDYFTNFSTNVKPNYMQMKALKEISKLRGRGVNKALIIAATASGKTYLAAFDAKNFDAKRLLFIVHRDTILVDAMKSFQTVFGSNIAFGFFTGKQKDIDCDFLFTTNVSLANNLDLFAKGEFDYIVIDEVHHATASTYQKILSHFEPQFLLGLTATPERMDDKSVYDLFEKNVPYELRLRDALENDLVVPFKYYGIYDSFLDYSESDVFKLIRQISSETNIGFIRDNIEKYKPVGKLKAIGFCRSIEHARIMNEKIGILGYHTTYLTGNNSTGERIAAYKALEDENNHLEIIFTVDLLNEGIDIPGINMVLFLRPTESSTIFIQQLGRGLRKYPNKKFLTVLDFIGNNYTRSVQIAIALGGLSRNVNVDKRLLSSYVREDFVQLDLGIEIHLDEISKNKILESIEKTNFNTKAILEQEYRSFKKYLGLDTFIKHVDYLNSDVATNILRYIKKYGSYYHFLLVITEDVPLFSTIETAFLKYLSSFLPLVRPYEFAIINALITGPISYDALMMRVRDEKFDKSQFDHALKNLQFLLFSEKERNLKTKFIDYNEGLFSLSFSPCDAFIEFAKDLLEYGLLRYSNDFYNCFSLLNLYYTYDRTSLLTVLCNPYLACREGIFYKDKQVYLFVDLKKDENINEWLKYQDKFLNDRVLQWESQIATTLTNSKGKKLIDQKIAHVFVRKIEKEDGITLPYVFIGKGELANPRESDNVKHSLLFDIILENAIPEYLQDDFEIPKGE